jgi:8-oxo-dGTP diphosphatase
MKMPRSGYRGFSSKKAYEDHYGDPRNWADEIPAMEQYALENREEREMPSRADVIPGVQVPQDQPVTVRYVAGFAFEQQRVLLVRKKQPSWQAGLLNGVGGKIESGETPGQAMEREFFEETGARVPETTWRCFCVESGPGYEVHFFKTFLSMHDAELTMAKGYNDAMEQLIWHDTRHLEDEAWSVMIGNLHWLIPMAQDWRHYQCRVTTRDSIKSRPVWGVVQ